jgi:IS605 OrfB family transposase
MKLIRASKIVLQAPPEAFQPTIDAYTKAYNFVCQTGWDSKDTNGVSLHHSTYRATRENFGLPSQLAISARMKATESLKAVTAKIKQGGKATCPKSNHCSIRYDANSYSLLLGSGEVSIKTIESRRKVKMLVPEYFQQYLGWTYTSADLFIRGGKVFLYVIFEKEVADIPSNGKVVGIDRGIVNLAVSSNNQFFSGQQVKSVSSRYERLRSELQSKGHSGKRHLRKISTQERRFRQDVNHCVAKQIVDSLEQGSTMVLENLKGIRQNVRMRKAQRKQIHKWNFFQLESFLQYKGEAKGIKTEYVSARYTSQKCSKCGHISRSNRPSQSVFHCRSCGFRLNADLNASRNIRNNYLDAIGHPSRGVVNHLSRCSQNPIGLVEQAPTSSASG